MLKQPAIFEIYIMAVVLKFQKHVCVYKINIWV